MTDGHSSLTRPHGAYVQAHVAAPAIMASWLTGNQPADQWRRTVNAPTVLPDNRVLGQDHRLSRRIDVSSDRHGRPQNLYAASRSPRPPLLPHASGSYCGMRFLVIEEQPRAQESVPCAFWLATDLPTVVSRV